MPLAYATNRGAEVTVVGIEPGEFDAMVLPGGDAPSVIRENEDIVACARRFDKSGKPVAAICHDPQVRITAGAVTHIPTGLSRLGYNLGVI